MRAQLERVLASELFSSAGRHSRLLRYLVERTLAGEGGQLKEYVLGTDVFDRSDAYDPRIDSIVRVEARRLRSRLEEYYRGPGAGDPIVIAVPRGSYVPTFTDAAAAAPERLPAAVAVSAPAPSGPASVPNGTRSGPSFAVLGLAAAAIVALVASVLLHVSRSPAAEASPKASIAVLPFEHHSTREQDAQLASRLADSITTALAQLETVSVASRTSASRYIGEGRSLIAIARELNVQLVLEGTVTAHGDEVVLVVRLVDGARDRKVWVGEYAGTVRDRTALSRTVARDVAAAAQRHGSR